MDLGLVEMVILQKGTPEDHRPRLIIFRTEVLKMTFQSPSKRDFPHFPLEIGWQVMGK